MIAILALLEGVLLIRIIALVVVIAEEIVLVIIVIIRLTAEIIIQVDRVEVVILEVAIQVIVLHLMATQVVAIAEEITRLMLRRITHHIQDLVIAQVARIPRVLLIIALITRHILDLVMARVAHILRVALAVLMIDHLVARLIRVIALLHRGLAIVVEVAHLLAVQVVVTVDLLVGLVEVLLLRPHHDLVIVDNIA